MALDMLEFLGMGGLETSSLTVGKMETSAAASGQSPRTPVSATPPLSTPPGKSPVLIDPSSPQTNFVGKLKEFTDKVGTDQPTYEPESNGALHRCSVTLHFRSVISQDPPKYFTAKKEAEKQIALLALQRDFPFITPENVDNSKSKLQEQCVKVKISSKPSFINTPEYVSEKNEQGFFSTVSYFHEKKFVGPNWVDNSKRAKQEAAEVAYNALANS